MLGRLFLQSVVMVWLAHTAHTWGYGATTGVSNGPANGDTFQKGGGLGSMLMPSKGVGQGVGAQNGYGGYPTKGVGFGAAGAGAATKGWMKGYGAGAARGQPQGGDAAVLSKGNGAKSNGNGAAGVHNGPETKGKGYGSNGFKGYGGEPIRGYASAHGSAGLGLGHQFGNERTKGPTQEYGGSALRSQQGYGSRALPNGYGQNVNRYGQNVKGYGQKTKGYGQNPNGNAQNFDGYGPKPNGYGQTPSRYGQKPNGYGQTPNGNGQKPKGFGQIPNQNGQNVNGYGQKPNGYGQKPNGYGQKLKGYGQTPNRNGQKPNGYGQTPNGYGQKPKGYGQTPNRNGQKPNGYGQTPNGHRQKPNGYGQTSNGYGQKLKGYGQTPNGNGQKPNGYGQTPNGNGQKPNGYGQTPNGNGQKPNGYGQTPNGHRQKPNGYGQTSNGNGQNLNGHEAAVFKDYGAKSKGHGVSNGAGTGVSGGTNSHNTKGLGTASKSEGNGQTPNAKNMKGMDEVNGRTLKGGVLTPEQPTAVPNMSAIPQQGTTGRPAPGTAQLTHGNLVKLTQDNHQKLTTFVQQAKIYTNTPIQITPQPVAVNRQGKHLVHTTGPAPEPTPEGIQAMTFGPAPVLPQSNAGPEPTEALPHVKGEASSLKGQGANQQRPDCGAPLGQWMKIPRPGYVSGVGASSSINTKGLGHPYAQQPGYGQGGYLGAGYGKGGNAGFGSKSGFRNGYNAGVQPDYASLVPAANSKSGMSGVPFGGLSAGMGAEKMNTKYGIGGLQFDGQQFNTGINGAGSYGYGQSPHGPTGQGKTSGKYGGVGAGASVGGSPGKYGFGGFHNSQQVFGLGPTANGNYGYGRMSYEPEPAVMGPEAPGNYGLTASQYQPEPLGLGHNGQLRSNYDAVPYESLPVETDPLQNPYVNGDVLTPVGVSVEGDHYENMGYINGQVQPEEAPTAIPSLAYPALPAHLPAESSLTPDVGLPAEVEDLPDPAGTASIPLDSEPATETPGLPQSHEQPEDDPQQLPRQIHIQQHLKLHFHNQGTNDGNKYDLNGFFGNSGYQSENGHQ
ncbi:calymmin isoform X3 [Takifugu rubripes]|uniref:calymmin isoform X3 n=1 Tax=Takifugu rubripes TaxID=31033 RepID=UPI0011453F48|nr:fibroin heavy chain-like isoform X3 [Takifugu rubripes]